jgi:hypothetical protein
MGSFCVFNRKFMLFMAARSQEAASQKRKNGIKRAFWAEFGRIYMFSGVFLALRWVTCTELWRAGLNFYASRLVVSDWCFVVSVNC